MLNMQNVKDIDITEGSVRTIHDQDNKLIWGRLAYDTKYDGDTEQDGTPTPDTPINVDVVTGTQTVTISDGVDSEDYTINLGTVELCKIDNYQDYIYKDGDDWYVHKETAKTIPTSISDLYSSAGTGYIGARIDKIDMMQNSRTKGYCNLLTPMNSPSGATEEGITFGTTSNNRIYIILKDTRMASSTEANWNAWLTTNQPIIYYPLTNSSNTKITDTTLIEQLDGIHQFLTRYGYSSNVSGNLPIIINKTNL